METIDVIDPLEEGLKLAGGEAASRLGYSREQGRLAGQVLELGVDVRSSLALWMAPGRAQTVSHITCGRAV